MYGEPFGVPEPLETVFVSWFQGGEVFRSGLTYRRGAGHVFYFRPGHETYPTYHDETVRAVLVNAMHDAGVVGMVNLLYRGVAPLETARRIIFAGEIGEVKHVEASYLQGWLAQPSWGDCLEASGLNGGDRIFSNAYQMQGGAKVMEKILKRHPDVTAVVCNSDVFAIGALSACRRHGLRVPGDISIAGYDDFDFAELLDPALTTISVPAREMGKIAAERLWLAIAKGQAAEGRLVETELVVRGSAAQPGIPRRSVNTCRPAPRTFLPGQHDLEQPCKYYQPATGDRVCCWKIREHHHTDDCSLYDLQIVERL